MNEAKVKQIYELIQNNEDIRFQLENTEGIEEIVNVLNQNGIEVSVEEVTAAVEAGATNKSGELDEDALDTVAGGYCSKGRNWKCFGHFMKNAFKAIWDELSQ